jgi:hypothetical protein
MDVENELLPPRQLFRFSLDLPRRDSLWGPPGPTELDPSCRLPALSQLDGERQFAEVRMAWSAEGLLWQVTVQNKSQLPWCRESRLEESDGLQVWVDTRCTQNVHRATRFCHRFTFLPCGGSPRGEAPVAEQMLINRARENARPIRPRELRVHSRVSPEGYVLWGLAPAVALGGYDPPQHQRLGFTYAVLDRQLGQQTYSQGPGLPYEEDPSCWAELRLV